MNNSIITFHFAGNVLTVEPTPGGMVAAQLEEALTIHEKKSLHGYEAKMARREKRPTWYTVDHQCFGYDQDGYLVTGAGFYRRLKDTLTSAGYKVRMVDHWVHPRPQVFEPFLDRLSGFELRYRQDEFLSLLLSRRNGRFSCPPAFGKSFMIGVLATVLPRAKIHVITKRVSVLRERIMPTLCQLLPDVGLIGGGGHSSDRHRVLCITADSLHRSSFDADIVIADEVHELAADKVSEQLQFYTCSRMFGFSATHDMRLDNKDLRTEGTFGPLVFEMSYPEAVSHGIVSDIEVFWTRVSLGKRGGKEINPCKDMVDTDKKKFGIWRNAKRNALIARDARKYGPDTQVLITVESVEHALYLRRRLPEFEIVYAGQSLGEDRIRDLQALGLWQRSDRVMTTERLIRLTKDFEKKRLLKAICTSVWNVGVDFKPLDVLIRADAGGSPINDTQIPGRTSRLHPGKGKGRIHDYDDVFDSGFSGKSNKRKRSYAGNGWQQHYVT